jgi:hypothetical protein
MFKLKIGDVIRARLSGRIVVIVDIRNHYCDVFALHAPDSRSEHKVYTVGTGHLEVFYEHVV